MECRRGHAMKILFVCPSVRLSCCLSNACIVTKTDRHTDRQLLTGYTISSAIYAKQLIILFIQTNLHNTETGGPQTSPEIA